MTFRLLAVVALGFAGVASAQPDLACLSASTLHGFPYRRGVPIQLSFSVRNVGNAPSGIVTVGVRLSSDATITAADTLMGSRNFAPLLPGATLNQFAAGMIPANAAPGVYFVGGLVTSSGDVNPANDGAADPITISIFCPGDTDGNQVINFADLNTVLAQFGLMGGSFTGDVNGDGDVNFGDLNLVLANFGATGC